MVLQLDITRQGTALPTGSTSWNDAIIPASMSLPEAEAAFLQAHQADPGGPQARALAAQVKALRQQQAQQQAALQAQGGDTSISSTLAKMVDTPLEGLGDTFDVLGADNLASASRGAVTVPENYINATDRFMNPQAQDLQVGGFGVEYFPRAVAENMGDIGGSVGSRVVGGAIGGVLGGPPGLLIGQAAGPAIYAAATNFGRNVKEVAKNNGRSDPSFRDYLQGTGATAVDALTEAVGAKYLKFGEGAGGTALRRTGGNILNEGGQEFGQSLANQAATSIGTRNGLNVDARQAVGEGLIGSGTGGAASLIGEAPGVSQRAAGRFNRVDDVSDQDAATRLAQRFNREAAATGADLGDVNRDSAKGAEVVLSNTHNQLAEEIKALGRVLGSQLDPLDAASLEVLLKRTEATAALRDAKNKVKSTVSDNDIARLRDLVGNYQEGQALIDRLLESNELTKLARQGVKGGISQFTDQFSPVGKQSRYTLDGTASRAAASLGVGMMTGGVSIPLQIGTVALGRAIDKVGGNRSTLKKFTKAYGRRQAGNSIDPSSPSIVQERALDKLRKAQEQAAREAEAKRRADERQAKADEAARRKAEEAQAKARYNKYRYDLRRRNEMPGGGIDQTIYEYTGLKPKEVDRGLNALVRAGKITQQDLVNFHVNPEALQTGKVGYMIQDLLNKMADKGGLQRDPDWKGPSTAQGGPQGPLNPQPGPSQPSAPQAAPARPNTPQTGNVRNPIAYEAQARANQDRVTKAIERVNRQRLSDQDKARISAVLSRIGATNNREDATSIAQAGMEGMNAVPRSVLRREAAGLIQQIRHATRADAEAAGGNVVNQPKAPKPAGYIVAPMRREGRGTSRSPGSRNRTTNRIVEEMSRQAETIKAAQAPALAAGPTIDPTLRFEPMQRVAQEESKTKHGLGEHLRVTVPEEYVPPGPDPNKANKALITATTTNANAPTAIKILDELAQRHPDPASSQAAWVALTADALRTTDVPIPPYRFIERLANNGQGFVKQLRELTPGQLADADHGFENAQKFLDLYTSGKATLDMTVKLFLWSFLSRGVSPYTQESLFIDAFNEIAPWVDLAAKGDFNPEATLPFMRDGRMQQLTYDQWAKGRKANEGGYIPGLAVAGTGRPGAGATHNLAAFGRDFLTKMSVKTENGKTPLQILHELMSDPSKTGPEIRREFMKYGEGVGIDNKVVSFTLLVSGRTDVMVLDRVQMKALFDDGRFNDVNLYDGEKYTRIAIQGRDPIRIYQGLEESDEAFDARVDEFMAQIKRETGFKGKPQLEKKNVTLSATSLAQLTNGARGLMMYEALERSLSKRIEDIYKSLGRPQDASIGRFHWETWVASSGQEASHGTLDAVLSEAMGDKRGILNASAKQGEFGTYDYGTLYKLDDNGNPIKIVFDSDNRPYRMSLPDYDAYIAEVKKPRNGVIPEDFKVTETTNEPWFQRREVNRNRLDEFIRRFGQNYEG